MKFIDNGSFYSVSVSARELQDFAARWPCSGMRNATRGVWFQYDKRNGDLVDIQGERPGYDEGAVKALSDDAQTWAAPHLTCANCGEPLPLDHGCQGPTGLKFCDQCGGISEALAIGARRPVFLYEGALGRVSTWTGPVVGHVQRKTVPARHRFAPARFRVRMLDGSLWHGSGPTANGNYIRLRPMKGEVTK